jgi:putative peptidoglycan lipid II flippase
MNSSKKFVSLGLVVTINLALQFLFQWYIITSLGAGLQTDALFGAMAVPQFILIVLSGSLTMVLIPLITKYGGDEFLEESWNYFQSVGLLFSGIAVVLLVTANWWVAWMLPGFKGPDFQLTINLARIQLIAMIFSALLSVVWAIHSARGNFFKIEYTSIAANIIAFVLIIAFIKPMGVYAVAWITVIRVMLQVIFLMRIMGYYRRPNFKSTSFKEVWKKLKPLMAGNAYYKTDTLADRYLTSTGASGELTLLNLAQQLYTIASSVVIKVLANTMVPVLARLHGESNEKEFYRFFNRRIFITALIVVTIFILIIAIGYPLLLLLFKYKNFSTGDICQLWHLLIYLGGYWIAGTLGSLTANYFYSRGNTKTPTFIGVIIFTLYMPLKVISYKKFKLAGLAITVSIYMLLVLFIHLYFIYKKGNRYEQTEKALL